MQRNDLVALLAASWLTGAAIWVFRSFRAGRSLADSFAVRHPEAYTKHGSPRPVYLDGARRFRWYRFVGRQEYRSLDDPALVRQFDRHRRRERRGLLILIGSLLAVSLVIWWLRRLA